MVPTTPTRLPRLWPWITLLVVGIAVTVLGAGLFVGETVSAFVDNTARSTPVALHLRLSPGDYRVYQDTSTALPADAGTRLTASQVTVRRVGHPSTFVPVTSTDNEPLFGRRGVAFESVVGFTVVTGGTYVVHVRSPTDPLLGAISVQVVVAPSAATLLRRHAGYLALVPIGLVLALVGLVLLIVRGVQRGRRRASGGTVPQCPNGHPVRPTDQFCASCGAAVGRPPVGAAR
jgi:hypothetical protein